MVDVWFTIIDCYDECTWIVMLFPLGCLFIILPMMANLFQLNKEIKTWIDDNSDTRQILQPYILVFGKSLYMISIITGSCFAAIQLCSSHIFQIPLFSLNIPIRHKQIFKNKRIFSICLLENIPQICLKLIFITYTMMNNYDGKNKMYNNTIALISLFLSK